MKKFSLLLFVLLLASLGANYLLWDHLQTNNTLSQTQSEKLVQLEQQQQLMNTELVRINKQLAKLQDGSLDGMVRQANEALIDGWQSLVNKVDKELQNARKSLNQQAPANPSTSQGNIQNP